MYIIALTNKKTGEILKYWSGRNWLKWTRDDRAKEYITLEEVIAEVKNINKRAAKLSFPGDHIDKNITMEAAFIDTAMERIQNKEW